MLVSGTSSGTAQRAAGHTIAPVEPRSARRSSDSKCATRQWRHTEWPHLSVTGATMTSTQTQQVRLSCVALRSSRPGDTGAAAGRRRAGEAAGRRVRVAMVARRNCGECWLLYTTHEYYAFA